MKNRGLYIGLLILLTGFVACRPEPYGPCLPVSRFRMDVDTSMPGDGAPVYERDRAVLMLPDGFEGRARGSGPMAIYFHSGGGGVYSADSEAEGAVIVKYLLSKGYAVLSTAGLPASYAARKEIDSHRTVGSYITHRSILTAYADVMGRFDRLSGECFLYANSGGGASALNLVNLSDIPISAFCGVSPLLSMEHNAWTMSFSFPGDGPYPVLQGRASLSRIYGMKPFATLQELTGAVYEKEKVGIWDPYDYCLNQTGEPLRAPCLIFNPRGDNQVSRALLDEFALQMNAREGGFKITVSDEEEQGAHNVPPNPVIVGHFEFCGETLPLNLTSELIYNFFEEHRRQ
jgi:hypothetical protein